MTWRISAGGDGEGKATSARDSGFTLLEMIVVIVVIGLATGLVLQRGPPRSPTLDLRAAAEEVARTLRLARTRAISSDRNVVFHLDAAAHAFAVDGGTPRALPPNLAIEAVTASPGGSGRIAAIGFAPDGSSSGGRIGLDEGARHVEIGVDWLTGRVDLGRMGGTDAR